ncbi:MAG: nucleotide pyrophosphohydrolase [Acidimicrobiia bacterium]
MGEPLDIDAVQARLQQFAVARDWERFHNPKNLAVAAAVEVAELLELFQWLDADEVAAVGESPEQRDRIAEEIADVLIYLLRLADIVGVEVADALTAKIEKNELRFPPGN